MKRCKTCKWWMAYLDAERYHCCTHERAKRIVLIWNVPADFGCIHHAAKGRKVKKTIAPNAKQA